MNIPAIVYHQHGPPTETAHYETVPVADDLGPNDVRVAMRMAPVNPSDINAIEGTYAILPPLPAVGGREGVGEVVEVGAGVESLNVGQLVAAPASTGAWRESFVVDASEIIAFPADLVPAQAAMLQVNPATAMRMLHDFMPLQKGDWVIQNAANSAVGLCVIEIARYHGLRTVNLVRRADERRNELSHHGADVVLEDEGRINAAVREATGGAPIRLGLNAVGGDSGLRVLGALAPGGTHVTYGGMSRQPLKVPAGPLIFKDVAVRGYWVTRWYEQASPAQVAAMWNELATMMRQGLLRAPIEKRYQLADCRAALEHAMTPSRNGKVVFEMG